MHPTEIDKEDHCNLSITSLDTTPSHRSTLSSVNKTDIVCYESASDINEPYSVLSNRYKLVVVTIASMSAFFSPFSSNIYYPCLNALQKDMHVSSSLIGLTITMYMVLQGISPPFWGTIADSVGRRPIFIITFFIYILACIGLACAPNYAALITLRMLQSFGSSSSIAIGAGTIGDISTPSERGGNMGMFTMGSMLGTLIGPLLGGIVTYELGWRWTFWLLVIMASIVWLFQLILLPETLRKLVGNGSLYANPTPFQYWKKRTNRPPYDMATLKSQKENKQMDKGKLALPLLYFKEKDVLVIQLCSSLEFACLQCVLSSLTVLFMDTYEIDEFKVGLTFLAAGAGSILGSYLSGKWMDYRFKQLAKTCIAQDKMMRSGYGLHPDFPIEKARMGNLWIYAIVFNMALIGYGWSLYYKVHMAVPIILNFTTSFTATANFNIISTLLIDLFPHNSAAIVANNNLIRCLITAAAILTVQPGIEKIGVGWIFTVISLVLLISRVLIFIELYWGPSWRSERMERGF
ncbi:major facilitator superfamily domain-containing protein [Blakeslea trispora]|nr:major facilitator superfamily domain-containing protein [Blakeslea trispora]